MKAARTHRLPIFWVSAIGSQPITQLGVTLERGALGVYPHDGPIPGVTTTLKGPFTFGFIGYASVAQPIRQQHKVWLGIELAEVALPSLESEAMRGPS